VDGFRDVIPKKRIQGCGLSAIDLELLVCGLPTVPVAEWQQHSRGSNEWFAHTELRQWFWEVVADMTQEECAQLLGFVCGSSRLPAGGFGELKPPFTVDVKGEPDALPMSHTCFNLLEVPPYPSKDALASKLKLAIAGTAGFGFA